MASENGPSTGLRIFVRILLNIGLVWVMATYMPSYFQLTGGWGAILIVGVLLAAMNVIIRPVLNVLFLPLKFFATGLAVVAVNAIFLQLTYQIVLLLDPNTVTMQIGGGIIGWLIVALVTGMGNWVMKLILR